MPTLYVVATPIGNLEDVTLRALRVLREVGLIAAEDTRTTRKLLNRHEIRSTLISYNEHNREKRIPYLLDRLREVDVALVSEAHQAFETPGWNWWQRRSRRVYQWCRCQGHRRSPRPWPSPVCRPVSSCSSATFHVGERSDGDY